MCLGWTRKASLEVRENALSFVCKRFKIFVAGLATQTRGGDPPNYTPRQANLQKRAPDGHSVAPLTGHSVAPLTGQTVAPLTGHSVAPLTGQEEHNDPPTHDLPSSKDEQK